MFFSLSAWLDKLMDELRLTMIDAHSDPTKARQAATMGHQHLMYIVCTCTSHIIHFITDTDFTIYNDRVTLSKKN
jgi:hypothetical protein